MKYIVWYSLLFFFLYSCRFTSVWKVLFLDSFDGSGIEGAKISVQGIDHDVVSVHYGNYWRLLLPGKYNITVKADGYV